MHARLLYRHLYRRIPDCEFPNFLWGMCNMWMEHIKIRFKLPQRFLYACKSGQLRRVWGGRRRQLRCEEVGKVLGLCYQLRLFAVCEGPLVRDVDSGRTLGTMSFMVHAAICGSKCAPIDGSEGACSCGGRRQCRAM